MSLLWDKSYSVDIAEIDEQHKKLFSILNKALEIAKKNEDNKSIKTEIKALLDYADYHFATEEKYFKEFDYKDAPTHIKKHRDFKKEIETMNKEKDRHDLDFVYKLVDFLEDWLIEHIGDADKKYTPLFRKNGLK